MSKSSIIVLVLLAAGLLDCVAASDKKGTPKPTDGKSDPFYLRRDKRLQVRLDVVRLNPSLESVLRQLEEATGLKLTLDASLADHEPDLGALHLPKVPVWSVMELIAGRQLKDGSWEKTAAGYRLTGKSQAPRPPRPARPAWIDMAFFTIVGTAAALVSVIGVLAIFSRDRRMPITYGSEQPGPSSQPPRPGA